MTSEVRALPPAQRTLPAMLQRQAALFGARAAAADRRAADGRTAMRQGRRRYVPVRWRRPEWRAATASP
jgi:hypothetical protein